MLSLLERKHAYGRGELDTTALADAVAERALFERGDSQTARAKQVGARAVRYPCLFRIVLRDGRRVVTLKPFRRLCAKDS